MTLGDLKKRVLALIEEINTSNPTLTDDVDIAAKINYVVDSILHEVSRFKKIPAYTQYDAEKDDILDLTSLDNFYQLNIIRNIKYENLSDTDIQFLENGTALIKYYKYPTIINADTADTTTLEVSEDALECAAMGIAADILKADVSTGYGQVYANRYREMLQMLDSRYNLPSVEIEDGINI